MQYWIVDAFTDRVFTGNPAAVLLPEAPLPETLMRAIAAENNLSETAFAVREGDGFHLRWFTPTVEVDLCGHATLATSFVLHQLGHAGPFRFRTRSGVLKATPDGNRIVLDFPARGHAPVAAPDGIAEALGTAPVAVFQSADLVAVLDNAWWRGDRDGGGRGGGGYYEPVFRAGLWYCRGSGDGVVAHSSGALLGGRVGQAVARLPAGQRPRWHVVVRAPGRSRADRGHGGALCERHG
jgi:hypothetical protein